MKPDRPPLIHFAGVRELYLHFERIFLGSSGFGEINISCGHHIKIFDHHFFHMVKFDEPNKAKPLLMANEKALILSTELGFGTYTHDKQRAIYLESARSCLAGPDEIWEDHTLNSATWVYIKEFNAKPYAFTITLVGKREDSLVPVTSFPGKKRDAERRRRGQRIYP
jgi:phage-Barnase-EndoU-ColicinE5/D-RelE like nuclease2